MSLRAPVAGRYGLEEGVLVLADCLGPAVHEESPESPLAAEAPASSAANQDWQVSAVSRPAWMTVTMSAFWFLLAALAQGVNLGKSQGIYILISLY